MCNVVCVGIGQFLAPIFGAVAIVAIIGAAFSAIGRDIASASAARRSQRAREEAHRARLGKHWRKALKQEELAGLKAEIARHRCQIDFDLQHFRGELETANEKFGWGFAPAEIDARVEHAARNKREAAIILTPHIERLEAQAAAIKI